MLPFAERTQSSSSSIGAWAGLLPSTTWGKYRSLGAAHRPSSSLWRARASCACRYVQGRAGAEQRCGQSYMRICSLLRLRAMRAGGRRRRGRAVRHHCDEKGALCTPACTFVCFFFHSRTHSRLGFYVSKSGTRALARMTASTHRMRSLLFRKSTILGGTTCFCCERRATNCTVIYDHCPVPALQVPPPVSDFRSAPRVHHGGLCRASVQWRLRRPRGGFQACVPRQPE